jgi:hypothetical protein
VPGPAATHPSLYRVHSQVAIDSNDKAVAEIAAHERRFYDRKKPFRIYLGSTNSTRQSGLKLLETEVVEDNEDGNPVPFYWVLAKKKDPLRS